MISFNLALSESFCFLANKSALTFSLYWSTVSIFSNSNSLTNSSSKVGKEVCLTSWHLTTNLASFPARFST